MSVEAGFRDRQMVMRFPDHDRIEDVMAMETRLRSHLKAPLRVIITDNTHSIISIKTKKDAYVIRLHHMFFDAPESVITSLEGYITGRLKGVRKKLRAFINENERKIRQKTKSRSPRKTKISTQGRYRDLLDAYQRLNQTFFEGRVGCAITWGNRRKPRGRKSIRLGSYNPESEIIRINRALDRSDVPDYVLDDIIYHEMLHHHLGIKKRNGRRSYHHETFKKMEKRFPLTDRAQLWISKNLHHLLS